MTALDVDEDLDGDGNLDVAEDINGNGILDALMVTGGLLMKMLMVMESWFSKEVDGDGVLDLVNEDVDGDGNLDFFDEDADGDGY